MNKKRKFVLERFLKHIKYHNDLSPFPLWDSYDTEKLEKIIEMNQIKPDDEAVDCCAFCKNIHIVEDEQGNDICMKCGNIVNNDYERFKTMKEYLDKYGEIWGLNED